MWKSVDDLKMIQLWKFLQPKHPQRVAQPGNVIPETPYKLPPYKAWERLYHQQRNQKKKDSIRVKFSCLKRLTLKQMLTPLSTSKNSPSKLSTAMLTCINFVLLDLLLIMQRMLRRSGQETGDLNQTFFYGCCVHLLNLLALDLKIPITDKVVTIIKYFKFSHKPLGWARQANIHQMKLPTDVRWNSTCDTLDSYNNYDTLDYFCSFLRSKIRFK